MPTLHSRIRKAEAAARRLLDELTAIRAELDAAPKKRVARRAASMAVQIEELLAENPGEPWRASEVCDSLGLNEGQTRSVSTTLATLANSGRVRRGDRGEYFGVENKRST